MRSGRRLRGVVGRDLAALDDFRYFSPSVRPIWFDQGTRRFVANPQAKVPGTGCAFDGPSGPKERR